MLTLLKLLLACLMLAVAGSRLSNINTAACSRGSLECGTAWFMLVLIALAVAALVTLLKRFKQKVPMPLE